MTYHHRHITFSFFSQTDTLWVAAPNLKSRVQLLLVELSLLGTRISFSPPHSGRECGPARMAPAAPFPGGRALFIVLMKISFPPFFSSAYELGPVHLFFFSVFRCSSHFFMPIGYKTFPLVPGTPLPSSCSIGSFSPSDRLLPSRNRGSFPRFLVPCLNFGWGYDSGFSSS